MSNKICIKCGREFPVENFPRYKNRKGIMCYKNVCKECMAIYKHEHYLKDIEKYKKRAKRFREENHAYYISYLRNYYKENKEEQNKKQAEYAKEHRDSINAYRRVWSKLPINRAKNYTRKVTRILLARGELVKPLKCELCHKEKFLEAHHLDYSNPYDVLWLCKQCHEYVHHHLNEEDISIE